ncbi:MAG: hypothetical protein ACEPOZ_04430 [Marinifilaceae bacterium]
MKKFRSFRDIETEKYRLKLEKDLAAYKLEYCWLDTKTSWSPEKLIQKSIVSWVNVRIQRLIRKFSKS